MKSNSEFKYSASKVTALEIIIAGKDKSLGMLTLSCLSNLKCYCRFFYNLPGSHHKEFGGERGRKGERGK